MQLGEALRSSARDHVRRRRPGGAAASGWGQLRGGKENPGDHAAMSYEDLPADLRHIPLTDPAVQVDVVDLMLGPEVRHSGAVALMVCDDLDRGIQPIVLSDVPDAADTTGLRQLLDLLLPMIGEEKGAVLVGRGRRRGLLPTERDREWHQCAIAACRRHGVRLLGFCLATPQGVDVLPEPLGRAS
jgi:hypothetical protein